MAQSAEVGSKVIVTGHSLGAGAVNQLANAANGWYQDAFKDAYFVGFATPIVSSSKEVEVLNIGHENDWVFLAGEIGRPGFESTTDNLVYFDKQYSKPDLEFNLEDTTSHPLERYQDTVDIVRKSVFYGEMARDSVVIVDALHGTESGAVSDKLSVTSNHFGHPAYILGQENESDWLVGGTANDGIQGFSGDDILVGNEGNDRLYGDDGNDRLYGDGGNDTLLGGPGNDLLIGGPGSDVLNGGTGTGTDTAEYYASAAAVTINLVTGSATGGDAAGDTLSNVENVIASAHDDVIDGDDATNFLYGLAGNDTLRGNGGADTLYGREGNDVFNGGPGDDFMDGDSGASGADTFEFSTGDDIIKDFNYHEDNLWVPEGTKGTLKDGGTVLTYPGGTLTLFGVDFSAVIGPEAEIEKQYPWLDWTDPPLIA